MHNGLKYSNYALFRVLLGLYLLVHFSYLLPYSTEIFSSKGALPLASDSPFILAFPNILRLLDSPLFIQGFISLGIFSSICLIIGRFDRLASAIMVYILASLLGRNPLINNPSLPFVGWMLIFHMFMPQMTLTNPWNFPKHLFVCAWVMLSIAYSYSGYTKLFSPSWVSGDTVRYVYENPLARDYFLRDFMLWLPPTTLKLLTWIILYVELLFAPLALLKKLRPYLWTIMFVVQLGFLFSLNFPDLTFPMLLIHMLTFDMTWLISFKKGKESNTLNNDIKSSLILYDGECGLCNKTILFILKRDHDKHFLFKSIQEHNEGIKISNQPKLSLSTFYVITTKDKVLTKSSGFIYIFNELGGLYKFLGLLLKAIPKVVRDAIYDINAKIRYNYLNTNNNQCQLLPQKIRSRFI